MKFHVEVICLLLYSAVILYSMERIQETFKGFLGGEDAKQLRDKARAQAKCQELVAAREKCWRDSAAQTKETDECYQEELLEKRCLAQCLCSKAAAAFIASTFAFSST